MKERKQNAVAFLEKHRVYRQKIQYIDEQMFFTERLLTKAKAVKGEADATCVRLLKEQKELLLRRAALKGWLEVIEETVRRLPDKEGEILHRFFLTEDKRYAAEDLMEKLEFEKTHVYRLRDRALNRLGEILEGERVDVIFTALESEE